MIVWGCPISSLRDESARAVGGGRLFDISTGFFTKTAITQERKVEKTLPRWEMKRLYEGYKRAVDQKWGHMAKIGFLGQEIKISGPKKAFNS